jgi:hypothetical protein
VCGFQPHHLVAALLAANALPCLILCPWVITHRILVDYARALEKGGCNVFPECAPGF